MYLPLAGLMLLAAAWLLDLPRLVVPRLRARPAWAHLGLATVLVVPLGLLTYERARLWGDPIALHQDGVAKAPGNPRVRLNLGVTYLNLRQPDKALAALDEAKTIYDRQESVHAFSRIGAFIHYNLGAVLFTHKQYDRAAVELQRSLEIGGQYLALRPMANMLLGRIDVINEDWQGAAEHMEEALRYQEVPDWRFDLVEIYQQGGNSRAAMTALAEVARRYPKDRRVQEIRAKALESHQATEAAKRSRTQNEAAGAVEKK
jgi:tetratricopeptide (TPR) repeat protein